MQSSPVYKHTEALSSNEINENFWTFISQAKKIAKDAGWRWTIKLDAAGVAFDGEAWNLRKMAGDGRPSPYVLRTLSYCTNAHEKMQTRGLLKAVAPMAGGALSEAWQDLIKAYTVEHVLVRKKSLSYVGLSY